ncbi:MAG: hypothetical protein ACU84Q_03460 [Gammaproteobacteria bacterium]
MNWEAITAVGSLGSAAAVIVSLIYLARQVVQNTHALDENKKINSALTIQERSRMFISTHQLIQDSPYMAPIFAKLEDSASIEDGINTLTTEERIRLQSLAMEALIKIETQIHLYREGLLEEKYFQFNTHSSIRLRYPLWVALDTFKQFNVQPDTLELIEKIAHEDN